MPKEFPNYKRQKSDVTDPIIGISPYNDKTTEFTNKRNYLISGVIRVLYLDCGGGYRIHT